MLFKFNKHIESIDRVNTSVLYIETDNIVTLEYYYLCVQVGHVGEQFTIDFHIKINGVDYIVCQRLADLDTVNDVERVKKVIHTEIQQLNALLSSMEPDRIKDISH